MTNDDSEEYLNLPTPIEPLFHEDSSHFTPIAPAEPLFCHDSSSSHETPTLDIRRSWSCVLDDVEETNDVPKKRKRKSDSSTWKQNIINMQKNFMETSIVLKSKMQTENGRWRIVLQRNVDQGV